jgi:acetyltransferase-like isoleucine patch superfamily enzyme
MFLPQVLRTVYLRWKALAYRRALDKAAVIGDGFCSAAPHGLTSVLRFRLKNRTGDRERVRIGKFCNLSTTIFCDPRASVTIGDYTYFNFGGVIRAAHGVKIGSHCLFGPDVVIWDTDNHPLSRAGRHAQAELIPKQLINPYEAGGGPIEIGTDVWVCMGALILGGVTIGDGAIVGARSVVTKNVPRMTIVAGVPARIIGPVPI